MRSLPGPRVVGGLSLDTPCIPMHAPKMAFYMVRFDSLPGSVEFELCLEATGMRNEDRPWSIESLPRPCGKPKGPSLHCLAKKPPKASKTSKTSEAFQTSYENSARANVAYILFATLNIDVKPV